MQSSKNKLGLSIDSVAKTPKKYLGEPGDPHYIPDSPLIERKAFTAQEELELKQICALVLAQVPHSDDMSEDPFKYIAAQIQARSALADERLHALFPAAKINSSASPAQYLKDVMNDTATPSENSKRDTLDRIDYSTPMTSAGITPGETGKRFSDAAKRASSPKASSNLRKAASIKTKSRAISGADAGGRKSADAATCKSQEGRPPSKSADVPKQTLRLVQKTPRTSETHTRSEEWIRNARLSQPEVNKALPPPPAGQAPIDQGTNVQPINRLMKSIRKKKSQIIERRTTTPLSASAPPIPPNTGKDRPRDRPHTSTGAPGHIAQQHREMIQTPLPPLETPPPETPPPETTPLETKRRFLFRFFGKRQRAAGAVLS